MLILSASKSPVFPPFFVLSPPFFPQPPPVVPPHPQPADPLRADPRDPPGSLEPAMSDRGAASTLGDPKIKLINYLT